MTIHQFSRYDAIIRIRRGAIPVRPEAEPFDGRRVVVQASWRIDPDEDRDGLYRDEWAMMLRPEDDPEAVLVWIASGDLELLGSAELTQAPDPASGA